MEGCYIERTLNHIPQLQNNMLFKSSPAIMVMNATPLSTTAQDQDGKFSAPVLIPASRPRIYHKRSSPDPLPTSLRHRYPVEIDQLQRRTSNSQQSIGTEGEIETCVTQADQVSPKRTSIFLRTKNGGLFRLHEKSFHCLTSNHAHQAPPRHQI